VFVFAKFLRQIFVALLEFDITGNPISLLHDVAIGVEDLFYEPGQGAVLGPNEFARGLQHGALSFIGHTFGKQNICVFNLFMLFEVLIHFDFSLPLHPVSVSYYFPENQESNSL
jgi:Vacuolar-sorting-associated 13 protein C-terminal